MSFLKYSILATKKVKVSSNFITTKKKGQIMISNKQNFKNQAFINIGLSSWKS